MLSADEEADYTKERKSKMKKSYTKQDVTSAARSATADDLKYNCELTIVKSSKSNKSNFNFYYFIR